MKRQEHQQQPTRTVYEPPQLVVYGNIAEVTKTQQKQAVIDKDGFQEFGTNL